MSPGRTKLPVPEGAESGLRPLLSAVLRRLLSLILTIFLAAFLGAALVRLSPGFGLDERQLDSHLSESSQRAIQQESGADLGLFRYFAGYLAGLLQGQLGRSISLGTPVRELLADRIGVTAYSAAAGLVLSWTVAALSVLLLGVLRKRALDRAVSAMGGTLLCLPAAVVAVLSFYLGATPAVAIGVVLLPRIFRYLRSVAAAAELRPHVVSARSRGAGRFHLQMVHIWLPAAPEVLALVGVSVNMALGAAIPVEALCDSPGVGQLAWKAALGRDLPVLINITILIAAVTAGANLLSDVGRTLVRSEQ